MSSSCASDMNNRTAQPNATARMPHEKSTKKMPTRGLMRNVPASCAARFPGIERGRSVDDAVPGPGDGKNRWRKTSYYHRKRTEVCKHRTREAHCFYVRDELLKLGVNEPGPGRQAQLQIVRYTTSKLCDGDRQRYFRKRGSDCNSSLWNDKVNAAVVIAWHIPPFCNRQAAGPRARWDQETPGRVSPQNSVGGTKK